MYYPHDMMYFGPFVLVAGLFKLIFWIFIIWLIIKFLKKRGHWSGYWMPGSALNTLRDRYAKGEITKEEYEERKKVLMER